MWWYNASTQRAEAEGSAVQGWPGLLILFKKRGKRNINIRDKTLFNPDRNENVNHI